VAAVFAALVGESFVSPLSSSPPQAANVRERAAMAAIPKSAYVRIQPPCIRAAT